MRWAVYVARVGDTKRASKTSSGKPAGKRQFGRTKSRWDVIKRELKVIWYDLD
jgi:hypothetical protein